MHAAGNYIDARRHFFRAMWIDRHNCPSGMQGTRPREARSYAAMGEVFLHQGSSEADKFFQIASMAHADLFAESCYPEGHPALARDLVNRARIRFENGSFWHARRELEEAATMLMEVYPSASFPQGHPDLIEVFARIFEEESRPLAIDQNYNPRNFDK